MGAAVGADDKKSVNVELNIVPFIDLMSCLTAFLLVTAVWVNIAQINIQPKGKSRDQQIREIEEERVTLSVLIQADRIWLGRSRINEFPSIGKLGRRFASHEMRLHKPDPAIYREFERSVGLAGAEILFFDDLPENVASAREVGWIAEQIDHRHGTYEQIQAALRRHGIL